MPSDHLNAAVLHVALDPVTGVWSVLRDLALAQAASLRYAAVGIGVITSPAWPQWYATELDEIVLPSYRSQTPKCFGTAKFLWQRLQPPPITEWIADLMRKSGASQVIVYLHNAWLSGVFLPIRKIAQESVAVVATMHGMPASFNMRPVRHMLHRWMASRLVYHHVRLTSVDRAGTFQAERILGISQKLFTVIPNAVKEDVALRTNTWTGEGVFQIGYLGILDENKGWQIGAHTVIKLTEIGKRVRYVIAGAGPQAKEALEWQRRHPGVIEYLGHVSRPRWNLLPKLHALSLMSSNEGLPMSIIEALSIGLPVIATRVGGIPEAIQNDINGFLVSRNAESLAKAITQLYDHPMQHARLGCEGRRMFLRTFELSQIVRQYHMLYVDCVKEQILSRS